MQRSWRKNANQKIAGFVNCLNLGFKFGKIYGFLVPTVGFLKICISIPNTYPAVD